MKVLKWILKTLAALIAIIILLAVFADDIEHGYNKLTWTPPMAINGIRSGMTRSDVMFQLGEADKCSKTKATCYWSDPLHYIMFRNDLVFLQKTPNSETLRSMPFKNTQEMKLLLGTEDLYSESKDFNTRGYTYLKWGVTFEYDNDALTNYILGNVTWRRQMLIGKYVVKGIVVCPGAECPFDDEGTVKEDFKDRDYTYFIK